MKQFSFLLFFFLPIWVFGGKKDSVPVPFHNNVIKFNPTPMLVSSNLRNVTLSYERLIKKNQSLVLQLGYLEFLPFTPDSTGGIIDINRKSEFGLNAALDYRFYPLRRNQYPAPDGLYLGPYISYYGFYFTDEIIHRHLDTTENINLTCGYNFFNLGFMIGYQFIFWKRLSVDLLIFGPSLTFRKYKWTTNRQLDESDQSEIISEVKDTFREKFPILAPFIDPSGNDNSASFQMFFRYSVSIGFHF